MEELEASLGPSWTRLGASPGRLGRILGASWGVSSTSWERLEGALGRLGEFLGFPVGVLKYLGGLQNSIFLQIGPKLMNFRKHQLLRGAEGAARGAVA